MSTAPAQPSAVGTGPLAALRDRRVLTAVAVVAVVVAVVVNISTTLDAVMPVIWTDEMGYLSNAQLISGVGDPRVLSGRGFYYLGWSYLLVPVWWITSDPASVYRIAVGMSCAISVASVAPLAAIGRRFGLDLRVAVVLGAIVVSAAPRALFSGFALSENMLALALSLIVLAGLRFRDQPTVPRAAVLLLVSVVAFATHGRTAPVLIAAVLWVIVALRRRLLPALVVVVAAVGLSVLAYLHYRSVAAALYETEVDRESVGIGRLLGVELPSAAVAASGQIWYLQIAWAGMAVTGLVAVVIAAVRELRDRAPGAAVAAMLAEAGVALVSVVWISSRIADGTARLDMYTYGRYLDPTAGLLALGGLIWLCRGIARREARVAFAAQVVALAGFTVAAIVAIPRPPGVDWGPTSIPGLLAFSWPFVTGAGGPPWVAASIAGAVAALAFLLLFRRPRFLVPLIAVALITATLVGEYRSMRPFFAPWYASFALRDEIAVLDPTELSFDTAGRGASGNVSQNAFQFWTEPHALVVFDSTVTDPTTQYVLAPPSWARADELHAVLLATDTGMFADALWELPE